MTAFDALAGLIYAGSGLVLGPDKLYLLETRMAPLLAREKLVGLDALASRLAGCGPDHPLARDIIEAMTTNESLFFRDVKPFAHFREVALPRLARASPGRPLRLWSAASSSGQEAYSLAIIAEEATVAQRIEIVGTDLSREMVARAKAGLFTQFEVQRGLPVQMLLKHFIQESGGWRVSAALQARCSFQRWNLLADLRPLGMFDAVFLRNVLIYLNVADKARVLDAVAAQIAPNGLLYLGAADSLIGMNTKFEPSGEERGVYVRAERGRAAA